MGASVRAYGDIGYARGFVVFMILAALSLVLAYLLKRKYIPHGRAG